MLGSGTARAPPLLPEGRCEAKRKAELLVALKKRRAAFNTAVARAESAASRAAAKLQVGDWFSCQSARKCPALSRHAHR